MAADFAHESNFQRLTRLGFAARGFLYILIAALVILTGETEDLTGALWRARDHLRDDRLHAGSRRARS